MIQCDEAIRSLHLYLDRELSPAGELALEAHLLDCAQCRREYDALRQVVDTVRGSKPLYEPRPAMRRNLEQLVASTAVTHRSRRSIAAAVFTAIAACLLLAVLVPRLRGTSFTAYAADAHLRYSRGRLPLDIRSSGATDISRWLGDRLPFEFKVLDHPPQPGESQSYQLIGARLMQHSGEDVAYLAYTMHGRPVSLIVASSERIVPGGDSLFRSGNLLFHFSERDGLKLITWRDRGLVYALVSDFQLEKAQSCIVCHASPSERFRFENMLPQPK